MLCLFWFYCLVNIGWVFVHGVWQRIGGVQRLCRALTADVLHNRQPPIPILPFLPGYICKPDPHLAPRCSFSVPRHFFISDFVRFHILFGHTTHEHRNEWQCVRVFIVPLWMQWFYVCEKWHVFSRGRASRAIFRIQMFDYRIVRWRL